MHTGPQTNYPRQIQSSPGIQFSVIGEGLSLWRAHWGVFALGGVMLLVPMLGLGGLALLSAYWLGLFGPAEEDFVRMLIQQMAFQGSYTVVTVLAYALMGPTNYSLTAMTFKILRGESISSADLLLGWKQPLAPALMALVMCLAIMLAFTCCYIPGLILGGLFLLAVPFMVSENYGPIASIRASWEVVKDHWVIAAAFYLVGSLLQSFGGLLLIVGLALTLPLMSIWVTLLFRDLNRGTAPLPPLQPGPTVPPIGPGFGR